VAYLTFPQSSRIKKKLHFSYLIQNKKKISRKYLLIYYVERQASEQSFAFSVSKKVNKKAVIRNKIRRQLKEIIRVNQYSINKRYDMLLIAKQTILNADFSEVETEIKELLDRIGLWIH
tara:strand:+ start:227 stop:583 length:357 start_codon:yes stop_codon:yes gene_type:complete